MSVMAPVVTAQSVVPDTARTGWRGPLFAVGAAVLAIVLLFARDVADMARLWWTMPTYQHCLFVIPIVAWLIWLRRDPVRVQRPAGWWPGVGVVALAGVVWLIGEAADVALIRHAGVVALVQASVLAILGPAVVRAMLFPLAYLGFLVPFGEELTGPMQTLTAEMTMWLLDLTGVAAVSDGVFITTRAGWFEVAEACAGVRFLIAMFAYGVLVAHVCFRSAKRRALFMVAAIAVPVLANGVRAWGTIFAAEFVGVEAATGLDHIVYGWVFFALVMALIMAAAWPFFDRKLSEPWLDPSLHPVARPATAPWRIAPVAVVAAALPLVWSLAMSGVGRAALPQRVDLPSVPGWQRVGDLPATPWTARFDGADHRLFGRYGDARGRRVDVAVALYGWQGRGREIVAFGQGAVVPDSDWAWAADLPRIGGAPTMRILGPGKAERTVVTIWSVGGRLRTDARSVKLATLAANLTGGDRRAATLIVTAEGAEAPAAVRDFVRALGDPQVRLDTLFAQAQGG